MMKQNQHPNVIYILADDMGYGDFGIFSDGSARTPNLDRLVRQGCAMSHCYAASPVCAPASITKRRSAPRLNVAHLHAPAAQPALPAGASDAEKMSALQAVVMRQVRAVLRNTENVGTRFAEEARRIHEGDADERPIRGTATREERQALAEDGIDVMAVPDFLDDERLQ